MLLSTIVVFKLNFCQFGCCNSSWDGKFGIRSQVAIALHSFKWQKSAVFA
ncbi:MAG: hypothetical protein WCD53_09425 [Microcoleus sp.]